MRTGKREVKFNTIESIKNYWSLKESGQRINKPDIELIMNYIGEETGLLPHRLSVNIVDAHIYKNQLEAINKYLDTNILSRPSYRFCKEKGARLIDYQSGPHIPAPVAV